MTKVIGLTGGIASGKSTVSNYLAKKGFAIVDADQLVRELQAQGGALYQVLVDWLGETIILENGELNRQALANKIFSSEEMLAKSAQLQNPIIRQALWEKKESLIGQNEVIILDIPLLFEQEYDAWCDEVWLVWVTEKVQLTRLMERNGMTEKEARQRIQAQMPLAEKQRKATYLIDNNGSLENTYNQIDALLERE